MDLNKRKCVRNDIREKGISDMKTTGGKNQKQLEIEAEIKKKKVLGEFLD